MVVVRCRLLVLVVSALSARGPVVQAVVVLLRFGIFGGCSCKGENRERNVIPKSSEYWEKEVKQRRVSYRTSCRGAVEFGFSSRMSLDENARFDRISKICVVR